MGMLAVSTWMGIEFARLSGAILDELPVRPLMLGRRDPAREGGGAESRSRSLALPWIAVVDDGPM